ncbi:MAG TPA: hypothetical protein VK766_10710 [Cytophagaceae bacterium]|jgi:hypothetical protein|nr:hypothetical protein [Cytophagaceae bacterium]
MKKILFSTTLVVLLFTKVSKAQYEGYPALFGRQTINGGTARYAAIGGAGTSLGGDMGSSYVNPAGLGMYRKSEFSVTPVIGGTGTNSTFLGNSQKDGISSLGIGNLGFAICGLKDDMDKSDWRGGTFSLTMSRTNSFHNRISFNGIDPNTSIADYFVQQANGTPQAQLDAQNPTTSGISSLPALAYWDYLIDPTTSGGSQYTNYLSNEVFAKSGTYTTSGSQNQWNIAYGANYKDKLYIGATLGITTIKFKESLYYTETASLDSTVAPAFNNLIFDDYNTIRGTGVNLKLGYIYKISDVVRIGSTLTTPTYNSMNQQYNSDLQATYDPSITNSSGTPLGTQYNSTVISTYRFSYITPLRFASGISFFAGKRGFVSADLEYVPYQLSSLAGKGNDNSLVPTNQIISQAYKNILNLKFGGELRLHIFRLRAGLAYLPNPYKVVDGVNRDIAQLSAGAGVKLNNVYFDFGVVNSRYNTTYQPYSYYASSNQDVGPIAVTKNSMVNVFITMGLYFN